MAGEQYSGNILDITYTYRLIFAKTFILEVPNVNKWGLYCIDILLAESWLEK